MSLDLQGFVTPIIILGVGGRTDDNSPCQWRNQKAAYRSLVLVLHNISTWLYLLLRELTSLGSLISLFWPARLCQIWLLPTFLTLSSLSFPLSHIAHVLLTSFQLFKPTKLSLLPQGLCIHCSLFLESFYSYHFQMVISFLPFGL